MKRLVVASLAALSVAVPNASPGSEPLLVPPVLAAPMPAMSADALEQVGLTRSWDSFVEMDSSFGHLIDIKLVVDTKRTTTKYVVVYGGYSVTYTQAVQTESGIETVQKAITRGATREVFSELDLGPNGTAYGLEGAKAAANLRVEILAAEGKTANVIEEITPRITIYGLSDQYTLQAFDGETGEVIWSARVGRRGAAPMPIAATPDHVLVINGMNLHCLDALTGTELWNRRMTHAPGSGPTVTNWFVYVPMLSGQLEVFPLHRENGSPEPIIFGGRVMSPPVLVGSEIAWLNNQNTLFLAPVGTKVEADEYRVRFDEELIANLGTDGESVVYCATAEGAIYGIAANQGKLLWKQSLQFAVRSAPVGIGADAFVVTLDGSLHVLDRTTGVARWKAPYMREFVSATATRVYAIDTLGKLQVFDRATGLRVGEVDLPEHSFAMPNTTTDRIYIGTRQGRVMCLHESESPRSILHSGEVLVSAQPEAAPVETEAPTRPTRTEEPAPAGNPADPFGVGRR